MLVIHYFIYLLNIVQEHKFSDIYITFNVTTSHHFKKIPW